MQVLKRPKCLFHAPQYGVNECSKNGEALYLPLCEKHLRNTLNMDYVKDDRVVMRQYMSYGPSLMCAYDKFIPTQTVLLPTKNMVQLLFGLKDGYATHPIHAEMKQFASPSDTTFGTPQQQILARRFKIEMLSHIIEKYVDCMDNTKMCYATIERDVKQRILNWHEYIKAEPWYNSFIDNFSSDCLNDLQGSSPILVYFLFRMLPSIVTTSFEGQDIKTETYKSVYYNTDVGLFLRRPLWHTDKLVISGELKLTHSIIEGKNYTRKAVQRDDDKYSLPLLKEPARYYAPLNCPTFCPTEKG